ncbi:MAG: hypothetical protein CBE33_02910 [Candidatus Pelagibacter sp. TMED273]|nr:MAG: hypothetical protein CBE33_02910 [Candidatus Pelagibacter sp. TMED273]|tara:strand:- start:5439 stop:6134 length:696 start_codon:yes stop_codon:yes gene_type:complete
MKHSYNSISLIIPFYNEENTLEKSILQLISLNFVAEIILVNDGSNDRSLSIASKLVDDYPYIKLLNNPKNLGKGNAIKEGFNHASKDIIGVFDADLEYSPKDLKKLYEIIKLKELDFIIGSRFIGDETRNNIYLRTLYANKFLSFLFSLTYKNKITDIATCLKLFRKEFIKEIIIEKNGFSSEIELLAKVLKQTTHYEEFPISYNGRTYAEGKKIKFIDGLKWIVAIFKYR